MAFLKISLVYIHVYSSHRQLNPAKSFCSLVCPEWLLRIFLLSWVIASLPSPPVSLLVRTTPNAQSKKNQVINVLLFNLLKVMQLILKHAAYEVLDQTSSWGQAGGGSPLHQHTWIWKRTCAHNLV